MTAWTEITITTGATLSRRERSAAEIAPEAIDYFAGLIRASPDGWRGPLAPSLAIDLDVTIDRAAGGALATWSDRDGPLVTAAYLSGADAEADGSLLRMIQRQLVYGLHRGAVEPGHDLTAETARPLVAAVVIPRPPGRPDDYMVVGDAESCLAAALFGGPLR